MMNYDKVLMASIECALWADEDENDPFDEDVTAYDVVCSDKYKAALRSFLERNETSLENIPADDVSVGHDFWLTCQGHGAGFWDRGYGLIGKLLTKACHDIGEHYIYTGDDGVVYID